MAVERTRRHARRPIGHPSDSVMCMPETPAFSAELRERCDHIFEAFWAHPFLAGLRDGSLARERVLHYVGQDHQYLSAFVRCYGLGLSLSPDRDWMRWFHENVQFILDDETHPHHALCAAAGVDYADAQVDRLAPSAQAYVDHMLESARDTLGVMLAALLPCPWTYIWAANRHVAADPPTADHPFAGWWAFYASPECNTILAQFRERFDGLAADAGAAERRRMAAAFEASCHHEVRFWQMAWSLEDWTTAPRPVLV
jgi:thiaminase/transcriptional activator TenA